MNHQKRLVRSVSVALGVVGMTIGLTIGCAGTNEDSVLSVSQNNVPNEVAAGSATSDVSGSASSETEDGIGAGVANAQTVRIGEIDWYIDYEDAMTDAQASNRPVWLHFGENPG